jgi:hypothetical protein
VDGTACLTLQYRQSKALTSPWTVQYSTDDVNWIAVPISDLTQFPDDDENTERWTASVPIPSTGAIFLRLEVTPAP